MARTKKTHKAPRTTDPTEAIPQWSPYDCPEVRERVPVRMSTCHFDPRVRPGRKCKTREVVAVACATPTRRHPKTPLVFVVPTGQEFVVDKRKVDRAMKTREKVKEPNGKVNCDRVLAMRASGVSPKDNEEVSSACGIGDTWYGVDVPLRSTVSFDPFEFEFENGYAVFLRQKGRKDRPVQVLGTLGGGRARVALPSGKVLDVPAHQLQAIRRNDAAMASGSGAPCAVSRFEGPDRYNRQVYLEDGQFRTVYGKAKTPNGKGALFVGGYPVSRANWRAAVKRTKALRALDLRPLSDGK